MSPFRRALQTQEFGYRAAGFEATGGLLGDGTPSVALCEEAAGACVAKARKERTMDNVLVLVLCFLWNDAAS